VIDGELQALRRAAHTLVDGVADHLAALPSKPVWQPLPNALRTQLLDLPLPERPAALDDLVATAMRDVLPHAMGNGHPAFFGWVNPPPSPAGVVVSLAAAAMNPSVVSGDHADVHLERAVVRWLAELVGFPHTPGAGLLTSGASAATIVCLAGARGRALAAAAHNVRRDGLVGAPQLIAYVPAEAHSCVRRALELLGLGRRALREVALDGGRLDAPAMHASIAADRASGALPAILVGSAGTVNAGMIDPLEAFAARKDWDGLVESFMRMLEVPQEEIDEIKTTPFWSVWITDAPATLNDLRAVQHLRFNAEDYRSLTMPVQLIVGSESPRENYVTDPLAAVLPNARVTTLEGTAHEGMTMVPEQFVAKVSEFLLGVPAPTSGR